MLYLLRNLQPHDPPRYLLPPGLGLLQADKLNSLFTNLFPPPLPATNSDRSLPLTNVVPRLPDPPPLRHFIRDIIVASLPPAEQEQKMFLWDNLSSHKTPYVTNMVALSGHRVVCHTPYNPRDGPIE